MRLYSDDFQKLILYSTVIGDLFTTEMLTILRSRIPSKIPITTGAKAEFTLLDSFTMTDKGPSVNAFYVFTVAVTAFNNGY
jgi:hypothetical protein